MASSFDNMCTCGPYYWLESDKVASGFILSKEDVVEIGKNLLL